MTVPNFRSLKDHVEITITSEGLRIELLETEAGMFFESGRAAYQRRSGTVGPAGRRVGQAAQSSAHRRPHRRQAFRRARFLLQLGALHRARQPRAVSWSLAGFRPRRWPRCVGMPSGSCAIRKIPMPLPTVESASSCSTSRRLQAAKTRTGRARKVPRVPRQKAASRKQKRNSATTCTPGSRCPVLPPYVPIAGGRNPSSITGTLSSRGSPRG